MDEHAKEPWTHVKNKIWAGGETSLTTNEANAARIVACVNAMAGTDDPEAVMKTVRELFEYVEQNDQQGILTKAILLWSQMGDAVMTEYLTDKNGNRASIAYFGSEKAAQAALDSLINCRDCTNCADCINCADCRNCTGCRNCRNCTTSTACKDCTDCTGCMGCASCNLCTGCIGCREVETSLIVGPTRSDYYQFVMSNTGSVHAGCHVFENLEAARKHWDEKREGDPLGIETLQILDYLETRWETMNHD